MYVKLSEMTTTTSSRWTDFHFLDRLNNEKLAWISTVWSCPIDRLTGTKISLAGRAEKGYGTKNVDN